MRILIVGAGVGGITLAALLRQRGIEPVIVERATDFRHLGFSLALYPLGARVLHGLGRHERFVAASDPMDVYHLCNGKGDLVQEFRLDALSERHGTIRVLARAELMAILNEAAGQPAVRMGTTVTALEQTAEEVRVTFSDGTSGVFDVVVGADGLHSGIRRLILGEVPPYSTGWGAWVWWADQSLAPHDTVTEYWGAGRFIGVYPTRGKLSLVAGGPIGALAPDEPAGRAARIRERFALLEGKVKGAFDALPADGEDLFFWKLDDVRSPEWARGRVVLMGDAAAGFLPTAGVGASMAMESAAVLADELSRTDARLARNAIQLYVKRRQARVEHAQTDSRRIAKMMFVESTPLAFGRDQLARFYTGDMFMRDVARYMDEPI